MNFFSFALGILVHIQRRIGKNIRIFNFLQNTCGVIRVPQSTVEVHLFFHTHFVSSKLQCSSFAIFLIADGKQFLHIIIRHRPRNQEKLAVIFHIPLQLHHILISPGKEKIFFTTPFQKLCNSLGKRCSILQVFIIHVNHFMDTVMNPVVHLGFDQTLKAVHDFFLFIQFYCADFYNFERQTAVGPSFSSRTLIPFQVKYNVVHD